jgi:tRNA (guanine26-N2/guanine27-N2)-dimethyltransferase
MLTQAAIHALKPGGMLAVTSTDLRVLCGNQPDVCFARYGAVSLRAPYSKEMPIRILLHAICCAAADVC